MNEILERYKQYLTAKSQSLNYYFRMRVFLNFLESKKLDYNNLTQDMIVDFLNTQKYNEQSKNAFINAGRSFYQFLGKEDNDWVKLKLVKVEYNIPEYLTEDEIEKGIAYLITYHSKRITPAKLRAIVHFIFYSGARKEEVVNLKRADFDFKDGKIKLYGKGKKERCAYFPERIGKEFQEYFDSEPEVDNAFNVKAGKIYYYIKLIGKYLGRNVYPHLIRHSGARQMLRKGIPISAISGILGHSDIKTTMRYIDMNEEERRNIYKEKMK
jgi:site-specific recombinase XerD